MSRTTGEALRERMDGLIVEALARQNAFAIEPNQPEPEADEYVRRIAAAIVEELGWDRALVARLVECSEMLEPNELAGEPFNVAADVAALLDCAEVEP